MRKESVPRKQYLWTTHQSVIRNDVPQDFGPVITFVSQVSDTCRQVMRERNVGPWSLKLVKLNPSTSNESQQHTTWCANARNMLGLTMLQAFARAFTLAHLLSKWNGPLSRAALFKFSFFYFCSRFFFVFFESFQLWLMIHNFEFFALCLCDWNPSLTKYAPVIWSAVSETLSFI